MKKLKWPLAAGVFCAQIPSLEAQNDLFGIRRLHPNIDVELVLEIFYALLVTAALVVFYKILQRLRRRIFRWIEKYGAAKINIVKINDVEILTDDQEVRLYKFVVNLIYYLILGIVAFVYFTTEFSIFPQTEHLADLLFEYIKQPFIFLAKGTVEYFPNLVFIAIIVTLAHYVLKVIHFFFDALERQVIKLKGFYPEWSQPTFALVRILFIFFVLVMIFPYLPGSDSEAFKGISIFAGVVFSMGSSSAVANVISGIVLTYMRPFKVGDRVELDKTVGMVVEKNLLVTRIRTIKNVDITIPNSTILNHHITNYSAIAQKQGLWVNTTVTIGYDAPWRQIHQLLITAAERTALIDKSVKPFVLQTALNDFYVSYQINALLRDANQMDNVLSELHQHIQDVFFEAGVEIMSPHYTSIRDGNAAAIPEPYVKPEHMSKGFVFKNNK
ncbi:MAG: mechanosensitive ion channel family protein [Bacteroidia bacterium]|nr:mechanosensitive ion channel family protein [Bacteroidia bacterium]MDW8332921.1 mechanosensitive ion channel family protein [Bacteroidia bacterium]